MSSASNSQLWSERAPDGFTFNFNAFRLLTGHQTPHEALSTNITAAIPDRGKKNLYYRDVPADVLDELWKRYRDALDPLRRSGPLGAVLFQFAPWLTSAPEGIAHVEACACRMAGYLMAVEFRNRSWLDKRHLASTFNMLRAHDLIHVIMDAPSGVKNRAQTVWEVTNPALGVFVLFVHFLAVCTRKRFQIKELRIRQVAKACEAAQPCYKRLLTPLPPENARKGRSPLIPKGHNDLTTV